MPSTYSWDGFFLKSLGRPMDIARACPEEYSRFRLPERKSNLAGCHHVPYHIPSMYGIFTYIYYKFICQV